MNNVLKELRIRIDKTKGWFCIKKGHILKFVSFNNKLYFNMIESVLTML